MTKSVELCYRIKALREKLGATQSEFGELVGVIQQTVSAWEDPESGVGPSCDSLMKLGNKAPYPDSKWFFENAGIDQEAMFMLAGNLLRERMIEPPKGKVIAVPRLLKKGEQRNEQDAVEYVDAKRIPNPGAVAYCVVGDPARPGRGLLQHSGTVVILDTSDNDATDLQPFWGRVILLESTEGRTPGDQDHVDIGLFMGRLCLEGGGGEYGPRFAVLGPMDALDQPLKHTVGRWTVSMTTDQWRLKKPHPEQHIFDATLIH